MAEPNETLTQAPAPADTAPAQAVPGVDAVAEPVGVEQVLSQMQAEAAKPAAEPAPGADTPLPTTPAKALAGKYQSVEELERGYLELQGKFSQVTADRGRTPEPQAPPRDPKAIASQYTTDQLETFKEGHLMNLAKFQADGAPEKAAESAAAIRMIDGELRDRSMRGITQQYEQQGAFQALSAKVQPILTKHAADLQPGTPIYQAGEAIYHQLVRSGMPPNAITGGAASILALMDAGKLSAGVAQQARQEVTRNIQQNLQAAVAQGAGASVEATPTGVPDFTKMSDREFTQWKAKHTPNWAQ